jgi:hypothetical protein
MRPPILLWFTPEELIDELHLHELELQHSQFSMPLFSLKYKICTNKKYLKGENS